MRTVEKDNKFFVGVCIKVETSVVTWQTERETDRPTVGIKWMSYVVLGILPDVSGYLRINKKREGREGKSYVSRTSGLLKHK